jgi:hypothetical protein
MLREKRGFPDGLPPCAQPHAECWLFCGTLISRITLKSDTLDVFGPCIPAAELMLTPGTHRIEAALASLGAGETR